MEAEASGSKLNLFTGLFLISGLLLLYYAYRYLYTPENVLTKVIVEGRITVDKIPEKLPEIPMPLEGGEYTVNTWVYVKSLNLNYNKRKHILELKGNNFSTLLIGLGAFTNSLMVRVHTQDPSSAMTNPAAAGSVTGGAPTATNNPTLTSLTAAKVDSMFQPLAMDDTMTNASPMCDLPEIDLQRWVLITVVLSGRTTDVYLDGKLVRSCVAGSYYRVDPTGVRAVLMGRGGFDGEMASVNVANYAMNPGQIYRMYSAGPEGASMNIVDLVSSIFTPKMTTNA